MVRSKMTATERMRHDALKAFGEFPEAVSAMPTFGEFKAHVQHKRMLRWRVWSSVLVVAVASAIVLLWHKKEIPSPAVHSSVQRVEEHIAEVPNVPSTQAARPTVRTRAMLERRDTPAESAVTSTQVETEALEVTPIALLSRYAIDQPSREVTRAHFQGKLAWVNGYKLSADEVQLNDGALREQAESLLTGSVEVWREHNGDAEEQLPVVMYTTDDYERATSFMQQASWDKALVLWNARLDEAPTSVNALFYKGYCAFQLRDYATAEECFAALRFRNDSPFSEETLYYLAVSKLKLGDRAEAQELLRTIEKQGGSYAAKATSIHN